MQTFDLILPERDAVPVMVEVPHAGLGVPDLVRPPLKIRVRSILAGADIYVDKIFVGVPRAGATLLSAQLSRYVVDLNRSVDDIDRETVPDHPSPRPVSRRSIVSRKTLDGNVALERPLSYVEFRERIDRFYAPYHHCLESQLDTPSVANLARWFSLPPTRCDRR